MRKKFTILFILAATLIFIAACSETRIHKVTFINGSEVFETKEVEHENTVSKPLTDPTKSGYTFSGWFLELNDDGTGKSESFAFPTEKITKDISLFAAYKVNADKEDEVTIFFGDTLTKLAIGDTFTPVSGKDKYYDHFDFYLCFLEELDNEILLPAKYDYLDISKIPGAFFTSSSYNVSYRYRDDDKGIEYYMETYEDSDSVYLNIYDYDWENGYDVHYYVNKETTFIQVVDTAENDYYYIVINNSEKKYYSMMGEGSSDFLGDGSLKIDESLFSSYNANGLLFLGCNSTEIKPEYMEVYFSDDDMISEYQYIKVNEPFLDPHFDADYFDVSYYFYMYSIEKINVMYPNVLSEDSLSHYCDLYNANYSSSGEGFFVSEIIDGISYNYYFSGYGNDFETNYVYIGIDIDENNDGENDYNYYIDVESGEITSVYYNYNNLGFCEIRYDEKINEYTAFILDENPTYIINNTIDSDTFSFFKENNLSLDIIAELTVKDNVLRVNLYDKDTNHYSYVIEENEEITIDLDENSSYSYNKLTDFSLDGYTFGFTLPKKAFLESFSENFDNGDFTHEGIVYSIHTENGELSYVHISAVLDDITYIYDIRYQDGEAYLIEYSCFDGTNKLMLCLQIDENEEVIDACRVEEVTVTGNKFIIESIALYKKYGIEVYIDEIV